MSDVRESLRLLTKNKQCEQIAKVAHQKVSDHDSMSNSLRWLTRPWANRSGRSPKMRELANRSLIWVSQKTSDSLWKPMRNSQPWADATVLSWIATVYIAVNWIAKVYSLALSHGLEQFTLYSAVNWIATVYSAVSWIAIVYSAVSWIAIVYSAVSWIAEMCQPGTNWKISLWKLREIKLLHQEFWKPRHLSHQSSIKNLETFYSLKIM